MFYDHGMLDRDVGIITKKYKNAYNYFCVKKLEEYKTESRSKRSFNKVTCNLLVSVGFFASCIIPKHHFHLTLTLNTEKLAKPTVLLPKTSAISCIGLIDLNITLFI